MKITYFVHGTTTDNEQGLATGWNQGELSSLGIQQAKDLPRLAKDLDFEVMYSSDLQRAIDSAQLGFATTHKLYQDKRLREANYGDYNGGAHHFKHNMASFIHTPFPGGESYHDVEVRLRSFLDEMKSSGLHHIAIMAHEAPQLALEVITNGRSWQEAISENWRHTKAWQPGWMYSYSPEE